MPNVQAYRSKLAYQWRFYRRFLPSLLDGWNKRRLFDQIETYCMFIGYARSGHSLIGALLNAHPDAVIAHELDALLYLKKGFRRRQLFSLLLEQDRWFTTSDMQWAGYSYNIPGQWQRKYRTLKVLGDKKGGKSTRRIRSNPSLLTTLQKTTRVPVRIIHIVRNPLDNIATIHQKSKRTLKETADFYFESCETNLGVINSVNASDICTMHLEAIIQDPVRHLETLCRFLDLDPIPGYIHACADFIAPSPFRSREKLTWPNDIIQYIEERASDFPFLHHYQLNVNGK